ncbi:unnamed protein product [Prunus armeniaca]
MLDDCSPSSLGGERGSELESLGLENVGLELENDVFEDTAIGKETTDHTEASAFGVETTGLTEASDQSPVSKNSDSDSCMDEFDTIPLSALPVPQSTRDNESSEIGSKWLYSDPWSGLFGDLCSSGKTQYYACIIVLAANLNWPLLQFDVKNAFLHGDLKEEIYIDLPPRIFITFKEGVVCKLWKSFYGLKQSPSAWFERFAASMKKFGYVQSNSDHTLFLKRHKVKLTALIIYIDDMIVIGGDQAEMQNLQKKYILDLLAETRMLDCKPIDTPSEQNHKLRLYSDQVLTDKEHYQRLVGKLIYLAHTRPDIAYVVSVVSQFMHSSSEDHMGAVMHSLRYLKVTPGKGLMFCKYGHIDVEGYTDADWAGSVTDRRSTSGYFTFVSGKLVTWRSKKQKMVSRSSAEYRGMAQVVCELPWLRRLLRDLGFGPQKPMDLYCDNKAAIAIVHNPV